MRAESACDVFEPLELHVAPLRMLKWTSVIKRLGCTSVTCRVVWVGSPLNISQHLNDAV